MAHDANDNDRRDPQSWLREPLELLGSVPRWIIHTTLVLVVLSWVPFAIVALSRTTLDRQPPYHFFQDMDAQPKLKAQAADATFADRRAMRPRVEGTVARGELRDDDHYYRGYRTGPDGRPRTVPAASDPNQRTLDYFAGYPRQVTVDMTLLERGRERYNIFCAPCHGASGYGDGMVHQRALAVNAGATGWAQPTNLVGAAQQKNYGEDAYANGKLYNVISHGIRSMSGYASQIPVADRWAIVAYVRALQLSQNADVDDITPAERERLR